MATKRLMESLMAAGIHEKQISISGIPIRKAFEREMNRESLALKYDLDTRKKYVMISADAYGVLSDIRKMVHMIIQNTGYDILIVCGRNRSLYEKLNASYAVEPRIRMMGFVEQMEEVMAVSSCLLTKAGAITLTEALSLGLPTIVYRPLPGQERGNADNLSENGAIFVAESLRELTDKLRLLGVESCRKRMERAAKAVYRAAAADVIVSEVLQEVKQIGLVYSQ